MSDRDLAAPVFCLAGVRQGDEQVKGLAWPVAGKPTAVPAFNDLARYNGFPLNHPGAVQTSSLSSLRSWWDPLVQLVLNDGPSKLVRNFLRTLIDDINR